MSNARTCRQASKRLASFLLAAACPTMCLQCAPPSSAEMADYRQYSCPLADVVSLFPSVGPSEPDAVTNEHEAVYEYLPLARSNPVGLLEAALGRWEPAEGYRVTVTSQERVNGVLGGRTVIEATVMRQPYAVSFRWVENAGRVDRLVWMPSRYDNKLMVRPTGMFSKLVKAVPVDPQSDTVCQSSRRDVTRFGLSATLENLLEDLRSNQRAGKLDCEAVLTRYGAEERPAILLKRTAHNVSHETRTLLVWLDAESLRPMAVQQYGWSDELLASYSFEGYRPLKLSPKHFELAALEMK